MALHHQQLSGSVLRCLVCTQHRAWAAIGLFSTRTERTFKKCRLQPPRRLQAVTPTRTLKRAGVIHRTPCFTHRGNVGIGANIKRAAPRCAVNHVARRDVGAVRRRSRHDWHSCMGRSLSASATPHSRFDVKLPGARPQKTCRNDGEGDA